VTVVQAVVGYKPLAKVIVKGHFRPPTAP